MHQTDRVMVTKRSGTVESAGQLSSCLTSSRNDGIGPTGVQDVERTGVSSAHITHSKRNDNGKA